MKKLIHCQNAILPWAHHPNQMYEYGLELGIPGHDMLASAGLNRFTIEAAELSISWKQYRAIASQVDVKGPDDWGFELGKRLSVASHGLLSLVLLNCTSWAQLMDSVGRYSILISPVVYMERRQIKDYVYLTARPEFTRDPLLHQFYVLYITTVYQTLVEVGGIDFRNNPEAVCIFLPGTPTTSHGKWREFFNENIQWGNHSYQIRLHKELIGRSIDSPNAAAANSILRILRGQLAQFPAKRGYLRELRSLFAQGIHKQDDCANALYCSSPTLKRHLNASRTTFSNELMRFRIDEACWHLAHEDTSIAGLADLLGFENDGSVRRQFKRELGMTPCEFRRLTSGST